ncbi:MAG: YqgE/AlgH family protein [Methylophilaceae bacterium]|nr:YqgE/AlgH family protein [Methylophilaceae bacterium]
MTLENVNLTGHFLIAMPALEDPFFAKSVMFICAHNEDGAMGVVINRPSDFSLKNLFKQINLNVEHSDNAIINQPIHVGGPVQPERGFVLHQVNTETADINQDEVSDWDSSIVINNDTALTTSKDILEAVANGTGPKKVLLALGYAGWNPGQLEAELAKNAWLSVKAESVHAQASLIYDVPSNQKMDVALGLLGLDFAKLSEWVGHA